MANFNDMFSWFDRLGVTNSLLPFMLIFTVIFAILQQVKLFGDDKKNINMVIALIMGLLFVVPHVTNTYPSGSDPVEIINNAIPNVGVVLIAIILVMLLVGVFGHRLNVKNSPLAIGVIVGAFGLVAYIFGQAAGWWNTSGFPNWLGFLNNGETTAMLIILGVFLILIFFIMGGSSNQGKAKKGLGSVIDWFKDMLD